MISSAVCALRTLAFTRDAARLAAAAKAAGSAEWPSSPATRTVTSYLPGGLVMPGTVSVICDILGARWPSPADDVADAVAIPRKRSAARHGGHRAPHVPMLWW